jgi:hypothetical protein
MSNNSYRNLDPLKQISEEIEEDSIEQLKESAIISSQSNEHPLTSCTAVFTDEHHIQVSCSVN